MTLELKEMETPVSTGEDDMRQYLSEIRQYPRLSPEEERALARRCAEGDEEAIRQMVNSNLRLVVSVAKEYAGRGVPLLDLIQEGSIGLLAAAKKFDYTLDFRFSTYATKWIRQGVTRHLLNNGGVIRVPEHTTDRVRKLLHVRGKLQQKLQRAPTSEELAEAAELTVERVNDLLGFVPEICSLDAPVGDEDEGTLRIFLEDTQTPQPFESLVRQELKETLEELMAKLNDRQRQVLRLRFGLEDGVCYSLEDTRIVMGVSKERVRQIEQSAIKKLGKLSAGLGLEDFLV